jgi:hypothetical protein
MIKLTAALAAWGTPGFEAALKREVEALDPQLLPLQQGLTHSSQVAEGPVSAVVLQATAVPNGIHAKVGIFYAGIVAGSCCSDDPTPLNEQTEYCELALDIDRTSGDARATLLAEHGSA